MNSVLENYKTRLKDYYEKNETAMDMAFFIGGFIFDVFTLSDIDDPLSVFQQVFYLFVAGFIISTDFLHQHQLSTFPDRYPKFWNYRNLLFHFILGSLLSVYSLFFLKSASLFNSVLFVIVIMLIMVANEIKSVQEKGLGLKTALFVLCLFSFFSMLIPVLLGYVGAIPFGLSLALTAGFLYFPIKKFLQLAPQSKKEFLWPSVSVLTLFVVFYFIGWIPPVPLSLKTIGIYHNVEKKDGNFILWHETAWYKFWQRGDQDFKARAGDRIYVYAQVFAPKRFQDNIKLHWQFYDEKRGWVSSDRVKLTITGGRKGGFRGFSFKENYQPGEWRVLVETSDDREIGRVYFDLALDQGTETRSFKRIYYPDN